MKIPRFLILSISMFSAQQAWTLNTPTGFTGNAIATTTIVWSWTDNSADENGFRILDENGSQIGVDLPAGTTWFAESTLNSNTSYKRRVQSFNSGSALSSSQISVYTFTHSPSGISATTRSSTSINVSWISQDSVKLATRYGLERSTSGSGTFQNLLNVTSAYSSTLYLDSGLTPDTTYFYRAYGINGDNISSGFSASVPIRTRAPIPSAITSLTLSSIKDRKVNLSWTAVSDPSATRIKIVRTDPVGIIVSTFMNVNLTTFEDADFSINQSTFAAYRYSAMAVNADQDLGAAASGSIAPLVLFQFADTDGDGLLEVWDVANSTYSDQQKPANTANRLIQSLTVGTTRVLLIDIYRRSSVPSAADFDSYPDAVWAPNLNIVNRPLYGDFDGDGLIDMGLDLNSDNLADGAISQGTYRQFGSVNINVTDQTDRPISGASVQVKFNGFAALGLTNIEGSATFPVYPVNGSDVVVQVTRAGKLPANESSRLNVFGSNLISVKMADISLSGRESSMIAYPNPVQRGTALNLVYQVRSDGIVRIDLYDIYYRLARRILNDYKEVGQYSITVPAENDNGESLQNGLYFCVMRVGSEKVVSKVVVR